MATPACRPAPRRSRPTIVLCTLALSSSAGCATYLVDRAAWESVLEPVRELPSSSPEVQRRRVGFSTVRVRYLGEDRYRVDEDGTGPSLELADPGDVGDDGGAPYPVDRVAREYVRRRTLVAVVREQPGGRSVLDYAPVSRLPGEVPPGREPWVPVQVANVGLLAGGGVALAVGGGLLAGGIAVLNKDVSCPTYKDPITGLIVGTVCAIDAGLIKFEGGVLTAAGVAAAIAGVVLLSIGGSNPPALEGDAEGRAPGVRLPHAPLPDRTPLPLSSGPPPPPQPAALILPWTMRF